MTDPTHPPNHAGEFAGDLEQETASALVAASSPANAYNAPTLPSSPKCIPELARLKELEAANARLLSLVGELLAANQQLRERTHP